MSFSDLFVPCVILLILFFGLLARTNVFETFIEGASQGLKTTADILPALICLMTCIGMFKASGGIDMLSMLVKPVTDFFGFPSEAASLIFIRPLSGSGALAFYEDIISQYGPDSFIGRVASTVMGSSETTFYTLAVYFGAVKIKNTRHALPSALSADLTGWIIGAAAVRLLF
ncbi:MAG: spore maturation protein [Eubacterium sp.]|nr:spore maturation protein [Eubacterium sp.]